MTKKSEHSRHLPEDRTIRTIRKNRGKIRGDGSFFRDFRTSLGGPLSFHLSLSLTQLHWTLYHPSGRCTSRHRVKSGRAIISPLTAFEVYILYPGIARAKRVREKLFLSLSLSSFLVVHLSKLFFFHTYLLVQAKENKTEERGKCVLDRRAERCRGPH